MRSEDSLSDGVPRSQVQVSLGSLSTQAGVGFDKRRIESTRETSESRKAFDGSVCGVCCTCSGFSVTLFLFFRLFALLWRGSHVSFFGFSAFRRFAFSGLFALIGAFRVCFVPFRLFCVFACCLRVSSCLAFRLFTFF